MIIIYTLLSALFFVVSLVSYHFTVKTWKEFKLPDQNYIDNEHRLHHIILSGATSVTSALLSLLYIACITFSTVLVQFIIIVPVLLTIKHSLLIAFVFIMLLFITHVDSEEDPEHRFYRGSK